MTQPAITISDLRQAFEDAGICVSDWAGRHGFRRESVYAVLQGRSKGRRGEAHRIAVALGLKPDQALSLTHLVVSPQDQVDEDEPRSRSEGAPMS